MKKCKQIIILILRGLWFSFLFSALVVTPIVVLGIYHNKAPAIPAPYSQLTIAQKTTIAEGIYKKLSKHVSAEFSRVTTFQVSHSKDVNAYAMAYIGASGKTKFKIIITTATLKALQNADQIAVVVAHEYAHVILGHVSGKGWGTPVIDEMNSDKFGIYLMLRGGYKICEATKIWNHLRQLQGGRILQYTHPLHEQRAEYLKFPHCNNH